MIIDKIKVFFKKTENIILVTVSLLLGFNSFFLFNKVFGQIAFFESNSFYKLSLLSYFILTAISIGTIIFFQPKFKFQLFIEKVLALYALSVLIILFGTNRMFCLINNKACFTVSTCIPVGLAVYMILLGYIVIKRKKSEKLPVKNNPQKKKKELWAIIIIFIVFAIDLAFGMYHLSEKALVDEALWTFDRIPKFWNNISDGELNKTRISDKPGITVALISGAGLPFINPKEYKSIHWQGEIYGPAKNILDMNFALRFPVLLFNALMIFVFYYFSRKLFGIGIALISSILIWTSSLLLGISAMINPDAFLWIFTILSILSFFNFIKHKSNSFLYWSGIFFGFALLTKYVANVLFVFFFALIFFEYILNKENHEGLSISKYFKKSLGDYFTLVFFALLTFFIFLPATWIDISKLLDGTILSPAFQKVWILFLAIIAFIFLDIFATKSKVMKKITDILSRFKRTIMISLLSVFLISIALTLLNTYSGMKWIDFESIIASPKSSHAFGGFSGLFLANFYSSIFGIIPLALLALIFTCLKFISRERKFSANKLYTFYLIFFIILYYIASAINNVSATVRYQIVIYPLILIIAAIGINEAIKNERFKKFIPEKFSYLIVIAISVFSLYSIKPFYFSYASILLPKEYVLNLKDMGEGSYEAAQYLNNLPDAKSLSVWTDKKGVCTFFEGRCSSATDLKKDQAAFDYFVVSAGRESRTTKIISPKAARDSELLRTDKLYDSNNYIYNLEIGGRPNNFIKIFRGDALEN